MTGAHLVAVVLAAVAATLFGLAAVRQHGAVRAGRPGEGRTLGVAALGRLLREPTWWVGAAQAASAGALHLVALALAPILLVQPVGVLALPVTLAGGALRAGRWPLRRQVLGALLAVVAVAALTLVLLGPPARAAALPGWRLLLAVAVCAAVGGLVLLRGSRSLPDPLRCLLLATTAAVLFGLDTVLLRTVGHLLATGSWTANLPLLLSALGGVLLALPTGLWAMQTAYTAGAPQVVICCLTLLDPLTAVLGGGALLGEGITLTPAGWVRASVCVVLAVAGVLLLSGSRALDQDPGDDPGQDGAAGATGRPGAQVSVSSR